MTCGPVFIFCLKTNSIMHMCLPLPWQHRRVPASIMVFILISVLPLEKQWGFCCHTGTPDFQSYYFFSLSQLEAPEIYSKVRTLLLNLLHFSRGIMRLKVKAVNAILLSYTHFFFQMIMTNVYISTHSQESFMSRLAVKKENASGERKQIRILNICIHIYAHICHINQTLDKL